MNVAIIGATSQIAQDLLRCWRYSNFECGLTLYSRQTNAVFNFMTLLEWPYRYRSLPLLDFNGTRDDYDVIINFIGQGKPSGIINHAMEIMNVTAYYDDLILSYLSKHSNCRYIFISSGSVYGQIFDAPVTESSMALIPINDISKRDAYATAKLYAEIKHRLNSLHSIVDVRVFNFFSRHQDIESGFFITDVAKAIRDKTILKVSPDHMVRDYLNPEDFCALINLIISSPVDINTAIDCYSKSPIDKLSLLETCSHIYGLNWEFTGSQEAINATGLKSNYYSLNKKAMSLGYEPHYSSLDTVIFELNAMKAML